MAFSFIGRAQVFYQVDDLIDADLTICFVDFADSADAIVYFTDTLTSVDGEAIWHLTDDRFKADKYIYFTDDPTIAELTILKSNIKRLAAWLDEDQLFWIQ